MLMTWDQYSGHLLGKLRSLYGIIYARQTVESFEKHETCCGSTTTEDVFKVDKVAGVAYTHYANTPIQIN